MSEPIQVASDLRTPPLRPATVAYLVELRGRLWQERHHFGGLALLRYSPPRDRWMRLWLAEDHARRVFLHQESLCLNLASHRPQEGPPW